MNNFRHLQSPTYLPCPSSRMGKQHYPAGVNTVNRRMFVGDYQVPLKSNDLCWSMLLLRTVHMTWK